MASREETKRRETARGIIEDRASLLSVSTQEIKKDHWHRADSDTSGSYVYLGMKRKGRRERERSQRSQRKRRREKEREEERHTQGNISPRSAGAICSPVVKGRSVGSVCANSCELTAYIGLPFCSALASLRSLPSPCVCLSLFVRIHVHAFLLRTTTVSRICPRGIGCSARDLSPRARVQKKREKKQKKIAESASDVESA